MNDKVNNCEYDNLTLYFTDIEAPKKVFFNIIRAKKNLRILKIFFTFSKTFHLLKVPLRRD